MNKTELTDAVAQKAELTKADAERAVKAVLDSITSELAQGNPIQLIGFGTLAVSKRKARAGRNPKTGQPIAINAKNIVKFKAGKILEEAVN